MGFVMTRGQAADRLLDAVMRFVGHVRGGLPITTAVSCTLFGAQRLEEIRARRPEMRIVRLSEEERARFRRQALPVREAYVEMAGPRGRRLLELLDQAVKRAREHVKP